MDIQHVKKILGITTTKHDEYLSTVIPLFIEQASDYCNQSFDEKNLPGGVQLYLAKSIEFNMGSSTLKGRSMGNVSYSYNTELPESVTKLLRPYKRLRFV
ncbi:phage head-tail connector protein [Bacillus gobiensis]|uniref:phage head-tail connector protein n=1 Tax=Bacillus gobiensis TaxID=1441095 RepID=UPI003D1B85C0